MNQLFFLVQIPVLPWRHLLPLHEFPIKITAVFVSYCRQNIPYGKICVHQKLHCLIKPFSLQQLLEGMPCILPDQAAKS